MDWAKARRAGQTLVFLMGNPGCKRGLVGDLTVALDWVNAPSDPDNGGGRDTRCRFGSVDGVRFLSGARHPSAGQV